MVSFVTLKQLKRIDVIGQIVLAFLLFIILKTGLYNIRANEFVTSNEMWFNTYTQSYQPYLPNDGKSIFRIIINTNSVWQIINSLVNYFLYKPTEKLKGRKIYEIYLLFCLAVFAGLAFTLTNGNDKTDLGGIILLVALIPYTLSPLISILYFFLSFYELKRLVS